METVVQYNRIEDVTERHRAIVEAFAGMPIHELDIDHVNEFLNGLYFFMDPEAYSWTD